MLISSAPRDLATGLASEIRDGMAVITGSHQKQQLAGGKKKDLGI